MLKPDVEEEIERLKMRKIEITNRVNLASNFDDKEDLKEEIKRIQKQIDILEKL
jgi:hypothetical protein